MPYDSSQVYAKYLANNPDASSSSTGCTSCGSSSSSTCSCSTDKCSCCEEGLVAVYNDNGDHIGCLTPNDAELFIKSSYTCEDGFIRLVNTAGDFLGCVTSADYAALYQLVNP